MTDAVGRLIEFWGFKRQMGRIWALLYLSEEPLSAKDVRDRLELSVGTVSMMLTDLQRWGVVQRVPLRGGRSELFEAELNLWSMVSRVFRERELAEISTAVEALRMALDELGSEASPRIELQRARIRTLLEVAELGRTLLGALVDTGRVDVTDLARRLLGGP